MALHNIYTSIACNIKTGAADWGNNNLILFAACNSVALVDPKVISNFRIQTILLI